METKGRHRLGTKGRSGAPCAEQCRGDPGPPTCQASALTPSCTPSFPSLLSLPQHPPPPPSGALPRGCGAAALPRKPGLGEQVSGSSVPPVSLTHRLLQESGLLKTEWSHWPVPLTRLFMCPRRAWVVPLHSSVSQLPPQPPVMTFRVLEVAHRWAASLAAGQDCLARRSFLGTLPEPGPSLVCQPPGPTDLCSESAAPRHLVQRLLSPLLPCEAARTKGQSSGIFLHPLLPRAELCPHN